jgi:putative intracellular protease/amidase/YHS domain-containing protein
MYQRKVRSELRADVRQTIAATLVALTVVVGAAPHGVDDDGRRSAALGGLDPVALAERKQVRGLERFASVRDGHHYLFVDEGHRAAFEKDPHRYALRTGSACTLMPSAPAKAEFFAAHGGRIYYFGSTHCRDTFEESPAQFLRPRKNVAILVFDGVELLDFSGPGEVFASVGDGRACNIYLVAAGPGTITSQGFARVLPEFTLADCPKPDVIVIPGGAGTAAAANNPAVIDWIRATSTHADATLSVCTGAFLLGKAGLLDGLEATTHHQSLDLLAATYPQVKVVRGRRFVDNGKTITSAGVSAGIDASLHLVDRLLGRSAASEAARRMEYEWKSE